MSLISCVTTNQQIMEIEWEVLTMGKYTSELHCGHSALKKKVVYIMGGGTD